METPGFVVMLCLVAFAISPDNLNAEQPAGYSAKLISPTLGQVLYAGQQIRVEWKSMLPNVRYVAWCEMEVWLSLDGGRTFPMCITPILDPKATHFDWTVPNMPTNAAVLDIRFGCDGWYPESYSPQPASTFVIAQRAGHY